jgi:Ca2+-binding EF-hand superfamily protein
MKVALKSNSFTSEEAFLVKSLKFFDIYNTGELDFSNFFRSIEKIGVIIEKETLQFVFDNFYDQAHTGKLNIKNWAKNVVSQAVPDVVAKSPHAFSPIKAGAAYPDEVRPL